MLYSELLQLTVLLVPHLFVCHILNTLDSLRLIHRLINLSLQSGLVAGCSSCRGDDTNSHSNDDQYNWIVFFLFHLIDTVRLYLYFLTVWIRSLGIGWCWISFIKWLIASAGWIGVVIVWLVDLPVHIIITTILFFFIWFEQLVHVGVAAVTRSIFLVDVWAFIMALHVEVDVIYHCAAPRGRGCKMLLLGQRASLKHHAFFIHPVSKFKSRFTRLLICIGLFWVNFP